MNKWTVNSAGTFFLDPTECGGVQGQRWGACHRIWNQAKHDKGNRVWNSMVVSAHRGRTGLRRRKKTHALIRVVAKRPVDTPKPPLLAA